MDVLLVAVVAYILVDLVLPLSNRTKAALLLALGSTLLYATVEASGHTWTDMLPLIVLFGALSVAANILWDAVVVGRWRRP